MIENLEILEVPQFKNGEIESYKKGISFILNGFHFAFDADESQFLKFFQSNDHCKIQYRAVCFTLNNSDASALQEKITELES